MRFREGYVVSRTSQGLDHCSDNAVQDLESSRSLVRLDLPAGTGVRVCQMSRWTCNKQICAKSLVFAP